jgi:hypothetical protein
MKQLKEMDLDSPTRKTLVGLCQAMHIEVGTCRSAHASCKLAPGDCFRVPSSLAAAKYRWVSSR